MQAPSASCMPQIYLWYDYPLPDNNAVIGQPVLSDNAVKGYLICRCLNRLRCGRYLI